jgi:ATP-dependent Clp protease ATP-binding subunit ClpA
VYFSSLDMEVVKRIVDKIIGQLSDRLKPKKVSIELEKEARTYLAEKGYDSRLGARPIQRLIDTEITERLSKEILFGKLLTGGNARIILKSSKLSIEIDSVN